MTELQRYHATFSPPVPLNNCPRLENDGIEDPVRPRPCAIAAKSIDGRVGDRLYEDWLAGIA